MSISFRFFFFSYFWISLELSTNIFIIKSYNFIQVSTLWPVTLYLLLTVFALLLYTVTKSWFDNICPFVYCKKVLILIHSIHRTVVYCIYLQFRHALYLTCLCPVSVFTVIQALPCHQQLHGIQDSHIFFLYSNIHQYSTNINIFTHFWSPTRQNILTMLFTGLTSRIKVILHHFWVEDLWRRFMQVTIICFTIV